MSPANEAHSTCAGGGKADSATERAAKVSAKWRNAELVSLDLRRWSGDGRKVERRRSEGGTHRKISGTSLEIYWI